MSDANAPQVEPPLDDRATQARDWALAQLGLTVPARFAPASADASFRRYFRVEATGADGPRSWVVMDAPPDRENLAPFLQVADLMQAAGLRVPRVLGQDLARGFLLLDDLGRQTLLQALTPDNADAHLQAAIDTLIRWQRASRPDVLPPYDAALLQRELDLFPEWYLGRHLGLRLTEAQRDALTGIERRLIDSALAQPQVYVHRDYMPRNLMVPPPGAAPGVLDFQDAVYGPISYDVVSLFRDAFRSWPAPQVEGWMRDYWTRAQAAGLPVPGDYADFRRAADWMGLQRHLKVIGIFARICHRDGKPHYLADVPRFIGYVREVGGRYPEMAPLIALFDEFGLHA